MDFFAGSGTTGDVCLEQKRKFILVDNNLQAMKVMEKRFQGVKNIHWEGYVPKP